MMAVIRARNIVIDTDDIRDAVRDSGDRVMRNIAEAVAQTLNEYVSSLDSASMQRRNAVRRSGYRAGASLTDRPMRGASAVISKTRDGYRVKVEHQHPYTNEFNLFAMLDSGRKAFNLAQPVIIPTYTGTTTLPNRLDLDSHHLIYRGRGKVQMKKITSAASVAPRHLYRTALNQVMKDWDQFNPVIRDKNGKFLARVRKDEVKVRVVADRSAPRRSARQYNEWDGE